MPFGRRRLSRTVKQNDPLQGFVGGLDKIFVIGLELRRAGYRDFAAEFLFSIRGAKHFITNDPERPHPLFDQNPLR